MGLNLRICAYHLPQCPVGTVELAVADGLGDVVGEYLRGGGEVGNGAGHLQDAAVGAGRQGEALHGLSEHLQTCAIRLGVLVNHAFGHLRVAVDAAHAFETGGLDGTCGDDALADLLRRLTLLLFAELLKRDGRDLTLDVYTIEEYIHLFFFECFSEKSIIRNVNVPNIIMYSIYLVL